MVLYHIHSRLNLSSSSKNSTKYAKLILEMKKQSVKNCGICPITNGLQLSEPCFKLSSYFKSSNLYISKWYFWWVFGPYYFVWFRKFYFSLNSPPKNLWSSFGFSKHSTHNTLNTRLLGLLVVHCLFSSARLISSTAETVSSAFTDGSHHTLPRLPATSRASTTPSNSLSQTTRTLHRAGRCSVCFYSAWHTIGDE